MFFSIKKRMLTFDCCGSVRSGYRANRNNVCVHRLVWLDLCWISLKDLVLVAEAAATHRRPWPSINRQCLCVFYKYHYHYKISGYDTGRDKHYLLGYRLKPLLRDVRVNVKKTNEQNKAGEVKLCESWGLTQKHRSKIGSILVRPRWNEVEVGGIKETRLFWLFHAFSSVVSDTKLGEGHEVYVCVKFSETAANMFHWFLR